MVIATVGQHEVWFLSGPPAFAGDRPSGEIIQQRDQLGDIVALPAGQRDRERDAGGVDEQVVFGARSPTIYWGWPRQEPPKRARTWEPSTAARDQLITPAPLSFTSSL